MNKWVIAALYFAQLNTLFGQSWQVFDTNNSDLPSDRVNAIASDIYGNTWVGTDWGLARYDGVDWEIFQVGNSQIVDNDIRALACDHLGRLFIGTAQHGLIIKDGTSWITYDPGNSPMPDHQVRCITLESNGTAWIGTVEGIAWYDGVEWRIYNDLDVSYNGLELPSNNIATIEIRNDGLKCIGTLNGGFTYLTDTTVTVYNTFDNNLPDNTALGVAIDQNGDRWAACPAGALLRHGGPHDAGVWLQYSTVSSGIPTNSLSDIVIDQNDTKIIATQLAGIAMFSGLSNWVEFNEANSDLPDDFVLTLHLDSSQTLWAGTESGGLARYEHISSIRTEYQLDLKVYPTQTSEFITIEIPRTSTSLAYSIVDLSGRTLSSGKVNDRITNLDVRTLAQGSYVVYIQTENGSVGSWFQRL